MITDASDSGRRGNWLLTFSPVILFVILTGLCQWGSWGKENNHDERTWHMPAVAQISAKWPALDLVSDCLSASPPGCHWILAGLSKITGGGTNTVRIWNACFGIGLIGLIAVWLARRLETIDAALLTGGFAASNFVVKSAAWVLTDNAGLVFATASLLLMFSSRGGKDKGGLLLSVGATLSIWMRHIQAWILAPLCLHCYFSAPKQSGFLARLTRCAWCLLPIVSLILFFASWRGLVPPQWRSASVGMTLCPQSYTLTMAGLFLPFLMPLRYLRFTHWKHEKHWLLIAGLVALSITLVTPTAYNFEQGRWGGYVWAIAARFPVLAERSIFFMVMAPVGAVLWMLLWRGVQREVGQVQGNLWGIACVAWLASLLVSRLVFQRYYEPMFLVLTLIGVALAQGKQSRGVDKLRVSLFLLVQIAITVHTACLPALAADQ